VTWWRGFGSAGVPPAVLRRDTSPTIAGGTPALPNPILYNKAHDQQSDDLNRGEISGLANCPGLECVEGKSDAQSNNLSILNNRLRE
jgi:hypothetical protein